MLLVYVLIIAVFPCIYYSIHLVAIHACKHIPQHINTFLHNIFSFHSKNPKRPALLKDTQQFMKTAKHKLQTML